MIRTLRTSVLAGAGALVVSCGVPLAAQWREPVYSIGQPPKWRQQAALQGAIYSASNQGDVTLSYGLYHTLTVPPSQALHPVLGLIGGTVEGYAGGGDASVARSAGVRAFLTSRMLATSAGA